MPDSKTKKHRDILDFLRARFQSPVPFTRQDLASATPGLKQSSLKTYWSKWIKHFCIPVSKGEYLVSESFRRYATWNRFQRYVSSQVRGAATTYTASSHEHLIIYEFFMPLRNEEHLRAALDALFYKDTVIIKLKAVGLDIVSAQFLKNENETDDSYLERLGLWVAKRFGGYSINHVSGRFRADETLLTASAAAEAQLYGGAT